MSYRSDFLVELWRTMVRIRRAEEAVARMIESGEARCPCHLYIGQEGIAAGVCAALEREDTIWGGHRSHGHYLAKGGPLEAMFAEILGRTTGCSGGRGGSMHLFDREHGILGTAPIVAATVPLACGAALSYRMQSRAEGQIFEPEAAHDRVQGGSRVAVAFFGDGAMEEGHVHESMNLAALYKLPVIFVCENNLYSSHLHSSERRAAANLERAGEFHSIPSASIDGNDAIAVYAASLPAVERARAGAGPSYFECRTFRWRGHVGASWDLDVGVARRPELAAWMARDPIAALEKRLEGTVDLGALRSEIDREIANALERARRAPASSPDRATEYVWSDRASAEAACAG